MRKLLTLALLLFCISLTAAADDLAVNANPSVPSDPPSVPAQGAPVDYTKWELGVGFQYQHYKAFGLSFPNYGFNTDITRAVNRWGALEGMVALGFGHGGGTLNPEAKSLFVGGGPRVTVRSRSKLEPWFHLLVGLDHFRFTQAATYGSNNGLAFLGGGGVDYKFRPRLAFRVEADYLGTRYQSASQANYSVGGGIVFNF
jgi:opacity protein-like surface antigen